jgi:hypothetical protein
MAASVTQVMHKGKLIAVMDYTNCSKQEILERVEGNIAWVAKQKPNSLLTITDVSGQHFDNDIIEAFKKLAAHNKPFTIFGAVVGIEGILKIAYNTVMLFSGRNMPIFHSREEAMDWLASR